jgi:hypothetical protein
MTDFSKPVVTDNYASLLAALQATLTDLVRQLDPTSTGTHTNVPTSAVRFNAANARWELFNGSSWVQLSTNYQISITGESGGLQARRNNWPNFGTLNYVVGQLAWKNYGGNHTIFDASDGTAPDGSSIDRTNSANPWAATYPTLMGWNGAQTYGLRVDSARLADNATNAGTAVTATNANAVGGIQAIGLQFYQSGRDFPNGTLIETSIDYSANDGDPWLLEIEGNSYNSQIPFDIKIQGYIYAGTMINVGGYSNGTNISGLVAFNYGGKLCFWFPSQAYWHGYSVYVNSSYEGVSRNKIVGISNTAKPSGVTKEVAVSASIRQSWHSGNLDPSALGAGRLINIQQFFSSGTYTRSAGANKAFVEAMGGGGSGGNSANTTTSGLPGGGGQYACRWIDPSVTPVGVVVGAGGVASAGGTSSFNDFQSYLAAPGGNAGASNIPVTWASNVMSGGNGGLRNGAAPANSGAGGAGAAPSGSGTAGFAGGSGWVIVWEFA